MLRLNLMNLIVALYVTGCGAADQAAQKPQDGAPAVGEARTTAQPVQAPLEAPPPVEEASPVSLTVADRAALPACTAAQDGALAYARAEKTFYVCGELAWAPIDLRGPQGPQGEDGKNGDAGATGQDGAAGTSGKDGVAGKDGAKGETVTAAPPPANQFYESVSGKYWTKPAVEVLFALAQIACSDGWRLPTEMELKRAVAVGTLAFRGFSGFWADTGRAALANTGADIIGDMETTDKAYAYCVVEGNQ